MTITASTSLRDVAFIVCTALDRSGVTAVLTGGSAATVYAPDAYQSQDLDFVVELRAEGADPVKALTGLGYHLKGDQYIHADNPLPLAEFARALRAAG